MPPRRYVGRGRAPRASARRSTSSSAADQRLSTSNDVAPATTKNEVGAGDCSTDFPIKAAQFSPSSMELSIDVEPSDAPPQTVTHSGSGSGKEAEARPNNVDTIRGNPNSVLGKSNAPSLSYSQPLDERETLILDGPANGSYVAGGDSTTTAVVESSGKDAVVCSSDGTEKRTRMVKKTIKVVKKIIKRVPKRSIKMDETKADDVSVIPEAYGHQVVDPASSGEKEVEMLKTNASCSTTVDNSNTDTSPALEIVGTLHIIDSEDQIVKNMQHPEAPVEITKETAVEIEHNFGAGDTHNFEVQSMENEQNQEVFENKEAILPTEADENKDGTGKVISGDFSNEEGDRKRGRDEMEEENNNAIKPEDEMANGLYCSSEMEAMERRKRRRTEIFIGGLDKDAKEEDIRKVFEEVGEIVDVRVPMSGAKSRNKGYAFLRYASAVDAKKALEKFSNVEIRGKQCSAAPVEGNDTIYIGNIDRKWKDEDVSKLLLDIGIESIDTISVMKDPCNTGKNRGYAFIEFQTCKDAQIAFKKLQKKDAFGKNSNVKVAWAEPLKEHDEMELQKVKTVYAEFIPSTWDEKKLREKFKEFGEIDSVVLARNLQNSKRKDFAFISYKSREAAIACIEVFGQEPASDNGTKVNLKVSLALPLARGKQTKQVAKPVNKDRSKSIRGDSIKKIMDPKHKGRLAVHRYGSHRAEQSSVSAEHVQRQAPRWQLPWTGPVNVNHPPLHTGGKRPASALEPGLVHSNLHEYPRTRFEAPMQTSSSREYLNGYSNYLLETSLPASTRHSGGGFSHHELDVRVPTSSRHHLVPPGIHPTTSSVYSQRRDVYASGVPYAIMDHSRSKVHKETLGRSSLYHRY